MSEEARLDQIYRPAREDELDGFLELMREETKEYLGASARILGVSWLEFIQLFRSRGEVCSIEAEAGNAGFVWLELRERTLHVHTLILRPTHRGRGIAGRLLRQLERDYADRADRLELGVHESNQRARLLYERAGFRVIRRLEGIGFIILQKPVTGSAAR